MKKVLYLGYYDSKLNPRKCSPAASTMMKYVAGAVAESGYRCEIISPAISEKTLPEIKEDEDGYSVFYLPTYGVKRDALSKAISFVKRKRDLYKALLSRVDVDTVLIVYHSLAYIDVLRKIKKKIGVKIVLQVCEIYADVTQNERDRKKEMDWIQSADAYILSTEDLAKQLPIDKKTYTVCLGTYHVEKMLEMGVKRMRNVKHIIYAGTFDPRKGGVMAIQAAKYLTSDYHMHICGFGSHQQIQDIKALISEMDQNSRCCVTYDGCLHGEEYIRKIQSCDVGLSTQNPDAPFNGSSFPSKILSYMSNGLQVVSIRLPAIVSSPVGKYIFYYDRQDPRALADAIVQASSQMEDLDMRSVLNELNLGFCKNIIKILET